MADTDDCSTGFSDDMRESRELEEEDRGTATTLTGSDSYVDLEKHTSGVLRAETTPTGDRAKLTAWILVNTLATIGIVRHSERAANRYSYLTVVPGLHE